MIDWLVIILIPVTTAILAQIFKFSLLTEVLLFFGASPLYLFIRNSKIIKKVVLFSLIPWWPLTIIWEYLGYVDKSWFVQSTHRFLSNSLPLEDIPWGILFVVYVLAVWEYFFNKSKVKGQLFSARIYVLAGFLYGMLLLFLIPYFLAPSLLVVPYFFLWLGILFCIIPLVLFLSRNPQFLPLLIKMSLYFFLPFSLMDFTALTRRQWWFPGTHFMGTINFFGQILPGEEILFFWILCAPALVCWYEFFANGEK